MVTLFYVTKDDIGFRCTNGHVGKYSIVEYLFKSFDID